MSSSHLLSELCFLPLARCLCLAWRLKSRIANSSTLAKLYLHSFCSTVHTAVDHMIDHSLVVGLYYITALSANLIISINSANFHDKTIKNTVLHYEFPLFSSMAVQISFSVAYHTTWSINCLLNANR